MDAKTEIIRQEIESQFSSIRKFAEYCGIPSTTIVSALGRGVGGTSIDTIFKICDFLELDVNQLCLGKRAKIQKSQNIPDKLIVTTEPDKTIIEKFMRLSERGKYRIEGKIDDLLTEEQFSTTEENIKQSEEIKLEPESDVEYELSGEDQKDIDDKLEDYKQELLAEKRAKTLSASHGLNVKEAN